MDANRLDNPLQISGFFLMMITTTIIIITASNTPITIPDIFPACGSVRATYRPPVKRKNNKQVLNVDIACLAVLLAKTRPP